MKNQYQRTVLISLLSVWAFACGEVASSSGEGSPGPSADLAPAVEGRPDPAPAPAKQAATPASYSGVASPSGAKVVHSNPASTATLNGKKVQTLPVVIMVSDDEVGGVVGHYEKKLAGWQHDDFLGTHFFWQGSAEENSMEVMTSMTRPYVSIQEYLAAFDLPDADGAKTMITVAYAPKK